MRLDLCHTTSRGREPQIEEAHPQSRRRDHRRAPDLYLAELAGFDRSMDLRFVSTDTVSFSRMTALNLSLLPKLWYSPTPLLRCRRPRWEIRRAVGRGGPSTSSSFLSDFSGHGILTGLHRSPAGTLPYVVGAADEETRVMVEVEPALETERFFETWMASRRTARSGRTASPVLCRSRSSSPATTAGRCISPVPSVPVQKAFARIAAPISGLLGYRDQYPEYSG